MKSGSAKLRQYAVISVFIFISSLTGNSLLAEQDPAQHAHQNIIQTAEQFLTANVDPDKYSRVAINMGRLDSRLRLSSCDIPLTATLAPGSEFAGKTTVHVRCNSTSPWTVYISAHINLYSEVVQTAEPLDKGHILQKQDLVLVEEDLGQMKYGYYTDIDSLVGKQLKRRLPQQRVIKANYVKSPTLVKRGEIVSIVAENAGYSVKMSGTAMNNGARGDRIQVKNSSSKRIIEGTVKKTGVVSIQ